MRDHRGTLFTFEFDSGLLSEAEIEEDLIASSIEPVKNFSFSDYNIIRPIEHPFQWSIHTDPLPSVPEPASGLFVLLGAIFLVGYSRHRP